MAWERPPGRRPPERGGPPQNLEEILAWLKERYQMSPSSRGPLVAIAGLVLLALVGFSSYYKVDPEETAVVLRFGKFVGTADAGPHFKLPFGIETVQKVVTGRVLQREYGYRTKAEVRSKFSEKGYEEESLMLSGDLNVVNFQWIVQYKIKDPVHYLFRVSEVELTLDDIAESVVRRIVGNRYSDEVLTVGRASIADQAKKEMQDILDLYQTGLQVVTVNIQNANPPNQVKAAFNEVSEAQQEKERMINEAQQAYNQKVSRAVGEARQTITQAEGYALERVNRGEGDVRRFLEILNEYQKAPEITRRRMYLESFETMVGRLDHLYVIDGDQKSVLPLFDLNRMKGAAEKQPASGAQPKTP